MTWPQWLLTMLLLLVCLFLMLVVLLQRGRGGGLAGAFGGAGGSSAFGAKTGDVLTWITVAVAAVFLLLSVLANYALDQSPKPIAAATTQTPQPGSEPDTEPVPVSPGELPAATEPQTGVKTGAAGASPRTPSGNENAPEGAAADQPKP